MYVCIYNTRLCKLGKGKKCPYVSKKEFGPLAYKGPYEEDFYI